LYKSAHTYFKNESSLSDISAGIRWHLTRFCNNSEFDDEIDAVGDWYNWKGIKYLLFEYETHLAAGANVHLDWKTFQRKDKKDTIEHILPQTPDRQYWVERWSSDDIEKFTHDLGNLVVTLDNSSYGNKGFDEKKGSPGIGSGYANSSLFSEKELCVFGEWTKENLKARHKTIGTWMKTRWFIDDYYSDETNVDDEDDFDEDI